jgi:hypothetical protein
MKDRILNLARNPILQIFMVGVFSETAFSAIIMATMQTPPEAILDIGLQEILMIFEGEG